jgi:hypothetical protein
VVVYILLTNLLPARKRLKTIFGMVVFNFIVVAIFFEAFFAILLGFPALDKNLPAPLLDHMRSLYQTNDRSIVQFDPEFAQYDPHLFYRLKPGNFFFVNREYRNRFHVNSMGVRDEESALEAPEVIVLGDSFAMGWGVDQDEAFPQVIKKRTGLKVLNTGISSYGTIREVELLNLLDTSHLKYIVIQYCPNDEPENQDFYENGNQLQVSPKSVWDAAVEENRSARSYYPGKYFWFSFGAPVKK